MLCIFFCNHNYQEGTGGFIYKALILGNKQLLSNMIDHKTMQVPFTTRIAFLADTYIFYSNYPANLCIVANIVLNEVPNSNNATHVGNTVCFTAMGAQQFSMAVNVVCSPSITTS